MDFFITAAHAQGAAPEPSPFGFLLPMLVIFGAFYFLLIRPQQKKQKAHAELLKELKVGDEVITIGGILGRVTAVSEHYTNLSIANDVEIKVQKSSVSAVLPKGTLDAA